MVWRSCLTEIDRIDNNPVAIKYQNNAKFTSAWNECLSALRKQIPAIQNVQRDQSMHETQNTSQLTNRVTRRANRKSEHQISASKVKIEPGSLSDELIVPYRVKRSGTRAQNRKISFIQDAAPIQVKKTNKTSSRSKRAANIQRDPPIDEMQGTSRLANRVTRRENCRSKKQILANKVKTEPGCVSDDLIVPHRITRSVMRRQNTKISSIQDATSIQAKINGQILTKKVKSEIMDEYEQNESIIFNPNSRISKNVQSNVQGDNLVLTTNELNNKSSTVKIRLSRCVAGDNINYPNVHSPDRATATATIYVCKSPKRKINAILTANASQQFVPTMTIRIIRHGVRRNSKNIN